MIEWLSQPWPWYVAGPLIGLMVPGIWFLTSKRFGISSTLQHACAAIAPGKIALFQYDWKAQGLWNIIFAVGLLIGGVIASTILADPNPIQVSDAASTMFASWGIQGVQGLVPPEIFAWDNLLTPLGFISIVVGGFFVGFGARYAGGCTSGHAITGLSELQLPSLIAVLGFFAGGLLISHLVLPLLLGV